MISTIIFDLGGVLFENGSKKFRKYLVDTYSLDPLLVQRVINGELGSQYRTGTIDRNTFWRAALSTFGIAEDPERLEAIWQNQYTIRDDMKEVIRALRIRYGVFYLSDNVKRRVEFLESTYHFLDLFSGGVFSHSFGVRKPDPMLYQKVLALANASPDECVYTDDNIVCLEPARAMGMQTIHFVDPEQFKQELHVLGVRW